LSDLQRKNGIFAHIEPLTHGNQKKEDRVIWALQGMFEHGRVILSNEWEWDKFIDEYLMYPTKNVHDDLIDALSMISQLVVTSYNAGELDDEYEVIDDVVGF